MDRPRAAIVGASNRRDKFGNKSLRAHQQAGYEVLPVNPTITEVEGLACYPSLDALPPGPIARISLYVPPASVLELLDTIAGLQVDEVWFNPGTDTPEVLDRARALGIPVVQGCSIVALGVRPDQL